MGLLQRSELRGELRTSLGERTDLTDPQLDRWLNQGLSLISQPEVRRHYELEEVFTIPLVSGSNSYAIGKGVAPLSLAFNILGFKELVFYDSTTLVNTARRQRVKPRSLHWFTGRSLFPSRTGGPRFYVRRGDNLLFDNITPAGDAGKLVEVTVSREPTPFALDTDVSPLLDYFDHAIVMAAQYIAELRLGYRELAVGTRQELQVYVNQKLDAGEMDDDQDLRNEVVHESPMLPRA